MSSSDYRSTALLTEHFGFPPLALIDDVINAVNDIMYKCTQAMETYLNERRQKRLEEITQAKGNEDDVVMEGANEGPEYLENEIQLGTAKLETLLENQVDKNFDKFELYALRNIFTIPSNLIEEGWIRLKHHEGIDFSGDHDSPQLDQEISRLIDVINLELNLRKILKLQITKANKLVNMLRQFRQCLRFLDNDNHNDKLSAEAKLAMRDLSPINENLYFLLSQVDSLIDQVLRIHNKFQSKVSNGGIKDLKFAPTMRDRYIQGKSFKLLESIGVLEPDHLQNTSNQASIHITGVTSSADIENVKQISDKLLNIKLNDAQQQQSEVSPMDEDVASQPEEFLDI